MNVVAKTLATVTTAGVLTFGLAAPASAQTQTQRGGAAGLVAAVVQLQDVDVSVIRVGDVDVAIQNVLNNNRVLNNAFQNFLNNNDIDVNVQDVVDINILSDGSLEIVTSR